MSRHQVEPRRWSYGPAGRPARLLAAAWRRTGGTRLRSSKRQRLQVMTMPAFGQVLTAMATPMVAAAVELPVLLYNIPSRTAAEITPATLLTLAERVPNIVAVKDAVKDLDKAAWLIARKPDTFDVYAGNDIDYLPLLAVGAVGVVSVAGHFVADRLVQLGQAFDHDPSASRQLHLQLLRLFEA